MCEHESVWVSQRTALLLHLLSLWIHPAVTQYAPPPRNQTHSLWIYSCIIISIWSLWAVLHRFAKEFIPYFHLLILSVTTLSYMKVKCRFSSPLASLNEDVKTYSKLYENVPDSEYIFKVPTCRIWTFLTLVPASGGIEPRFFFFFWWLDWKRYVDCTNFHQYCHIFLQTRACDIWKH